MSLSRWTTGLFLGAGFFSAISFLEELYIGLLLEMVVGLACWEWSRLVGIKSIPKKLLYSILLWGTVFVVSLLGKKEPMLSAIIVIGSIWWGIAFVWVLWFQKTGAPQPVGLVLCTALGCLTLAPALVALIHLVSLEEPHLLFLVCLVCASDIFGYVGGRRFGKRPLASRISPGKTWEGLGCSIVGCSLLSSVFMANYQEVVTIQVVAFGIAIGLASVIGDLMESILKRSRGLKDSGTLLPGHGGVLDRIDGLLAAAPIYLAILFFVVHI